MNEILLQVNPRIQESPELIQKNVALPLMKPQAADLRGDVNNKKQTSSPELFK